MADDQGIYDSSDPAAIEAAAREAGRRDAEDDETIRVWMNHSKGRDLLFRFVFVICHLGETYIAIDQQGRADTHRTFVHLGERNMGAWLDERMRRHPELYMKMLDEQRIENELRNTKLLKQNERQDAQNV
jgi:hypothetical protein